jgi:hypothetical protein
MKRIFTLFFALIIISLEIQAQDAEAASADTLKPFVFGGRVGLNFSNVTLSNWAGGGQESVSGTGNVLLTGDYIKGKTSWKNSFEVAYGLIRQGGNAVIKSDDQILLTSEFLHNFKPKWSYTTVGTFRSQFAPGYDPADSQQTANLISDWLAPGYLQVAAGINYKPFDYLSFMLSPVTYKLTIVGNQTLANRGDYGVEAAVLDTSGNVITPGKNIRNEVGASFRMNFKKEILKNVEFESVLDLFSNYIEDPAVIDVNWINNLNMKINNVMTASILTQMIYDQDIKIASEGNAGGSPKIQFKSVLGIGIAYTF